MSQEQILENMEYQREVIFLRLRPERVLFEQSVFYLKIWPLHFAFKHLISWKTSDLSLILCKEENLGTKERRIKRACKALSFERNGLLLHFYLEETCSKHRSPKSLLNIQSSHFEKVVFCLIKVNRESRHKNLGFSLESLNKVREFFCSNHEFCLFIL